MDTMFGYPVVESEDVPESPPHSIRFGDWSSYVIVKVTLPGKEPVEMTLAEFRRLLKEEPPDDPEQLTEKDLRWVAYSTQFGQAQNLNVLVNGNFCHISERRQEGPPIVIALFPSEVRELIPILESALLKLRARGNLPGEVAG